MLTWDEIKAEANLAKHGVSFALARQFDWDTAVTIEDQRRDYGESRFSSTGYIGTRLYVLVFTPRGNDLRVISLRKANRRDVRDYDQQQG